jgi:pyruvate formate lyase activating enzyme
MEIAHLQLLSLLDYPRKVSAVVWTVGCNLRCPFCYNAELVLPELGAALPRLLVGDVLARLRERAGFLDGVVVTGGEPTLQAGLPAFLGEVKSLGFLVKLDTNGTRPDVLRSLLGERLVDYMAVDVKAPFARYPEFTGGAPPSHKGPVASHLVCDGLSCCIPDVEDRVRGTIALVRDLAPDYEFRTTVAPGLAQEDLLAIAGEIRGARRYVLQPFFIPEGKRLVDETWRGRPVLSSEELRLFLPTVRELVPVELRG